MLEENLERTFSAEALKQMGGYVKRGLDIHVKVRIENPKGHRIQQLFVKNEPVQDGRKYNVAFLTSQGVPEHIGENRNNLTIKAIDALKMYLQKNPGYAPLINNTFSLV